MPTYRSSTKRLAFSVKGNLKRFSNGFFTTDDKYEVEVLEKLSLASKLEEPKAEVKPKAEEPKAKAPAKRQTSAK